jgi:hypothetical protein
MRASVKHDMIRRWQFSRKSKKRLAKDSRRLTTMQA